MEDCDEMSGAAGLLHTTLRNVRLKKQLQGYMAMPGTLEDALDRQSDDLNTLLRDLKRVGPTNGAARRKAVNGRPVTP